MSAPDAKRDEPGGDAASTEEEANLWKAHAGSRSAVSRERLFAFYAPFAAAVARRHHRSQNWGDIELADLCQLAYVGLLEALDRYDPALGAPFRAFAAHRINGSIRDGVARLSEMREQISWHRRVRRERVQSLSSGAAQQASRPIEKLAEIATGLALGFMLEGTGLFAALERESDIQVPPETAYDSLAWNETLAHLHEELDILPEREQTILRQHYLNGASFDQLASLLGLSRGRISQLHHAALEALRKRLKSQGHFRIVR